MQAETTASPGAGKWPVGAWIAVAALAAGATGLAGGLALNQREAPRAVAVAPAAAVTAPATSLAIPEAPADGEAPAKAPVQQREVAPAARPAPAAPPAARVAARPAAPAPAPAAVCRDCGVIESVQAVQVKGDGSGAGAVAGGVLGGVVGNQFGSNSGRAAMTVLGAVGGGVAGNEVEKRVRTKTVYSVRVRMDDGGMRTLQQSQAPATGARVRVDGATLHGI